MFMMVLGALVAFTVIILIVANSITDSAEEQRGEDPRLRAAIVDRISPIGQVNLAGAPAPAAEAAPKAQSGADLVGAVCNSCHLAGVLEAPKTGDKAAWSQRLETAGGVDALVASVINGKGAMPPKGGSSASDAEIRAAVEYYLQEAGVDVASAAGGGDAPAADAETGSAADAGSAAASENAPADPVAAATSMVGEAMDTAASMAAAVMPGSAPEPEPAPAAATPVEGPDLAKGKAVYDQACFACHMTGAAGAPKFGDVAAWTPRVAQGMDALYQSSINGKGAMPPKGGRLDIADADIKAAVAYMVDAVK
jgi:cytochrome c5